jgi:hypothetical protein
VSSDLIDVRLADVNQPVALTPVKPIALTPVKPAAPPPVNRLL